MRYLNSASGVYVCAAVTSSVLQRWIRFMISSDVTWAFVTVLINRSGEHIFTSSEICFNPFVTYSYKLSLPPLPPSLSLSPLSSRSLCLSLTYTDTHTHTHTRTCTHTCTHTHAGTPTHTHTRARAPARAYHSHFL